MKRKTSRLLSLLLVLCMVLALLPTATFAVEDSTPPDIWDGSIAENYAGGSGTSNDPYKIATAGQLAKLANTSGATGYYILTSDIYLNDTTSETWYLDNSATAWSSSGDFNGVFDGQDHKIFGLYQCGLFGIATKSTIQNVHIRDCYINTYVDYNGSSIFAGAVVAYGGTIIGCSNDGTISIEGDGYIGGIAGRASTISECYNSGSVSLSRQSYGTGSAGGIAGYGGPVDRCYNEGDVLVNGSSTQQYAGGIIGSTGGTISDCYNIGTITNNRLYAPAGGILGYAIGPSSISRCYSVGSLSGSYYNGDIIGLTEGGPGNRMNPTLTNCYAQNRLVGRAANAGDYGGYTNDGSEILDGASMKDKDSYVGFDFDTIWDIDPDVNNGYPTLKGVGPETDEGDTPPGGEDTPIGEITLQLDSDTISAGNEAYITALFSHDGNFQQEDVTWTSDNENIVSIVTYGALISDKNASSTVTIKGISEGSATITVSLTDGRSASCEVNVARDHILWEKVDISELESSALQQDLHAYIYFDQELDAEAIESNGGCIQIWGNVNGTKTLLREIRSQSPNGDFFYVSEKDPTCLIVEIYNSIPLTWNASLKALPYNATLYITMDTDAVVFKNRDLIFSGIGQDKAITAKTAWGLTADVDFLSFVNNYNDTIYGGFSKYSHYTISKEMYTYLQLKTMPFHPLAGVMLDVNTYFKTWSGSCMGMSSVMALAAINEIDLTAWDENAKNCATLAYPVNSTHAFGTQDLINYYQFLQYFIDYPEQKATRGFVNWTIVVGELIDKAQHFDVTRTPIILDLVIYDNENKRHVHSCLAYGYRETADSYILTLYDPSYPNKTETTLTITKNGYEATLIGGWGSGSVCKVTTIGYIDPYDLEEYNIDSMATESTLSLEMEEDNSNTNTILLCAVNSDFCVTNSSGELIKFEDGIFDSTMEISSVKPLGEGTTGIFEIIVPKSETFTYVAEDGNSDFAVMQDDCYLEAVSSGSNIEVTIVPGESVVISGDNNIPYQLIATLFSDDGEMVSIEGSTDTSVTAQYTDDKKQIEVVTDDLDDIRVSVLHDGEVEETTVDSTGKDPVISTPANGGDGNGADSGTSSSSYQITAPAAENGTVIIMPKSAKSGEKVTITAKPDDGYIVSSVTVKDSSGKSISVTDNGDGTYTFTMPNSAVTVNASFTSIDGGNNNNNNNNGNGNGSNGNNGNSTSSGTPSNSSYQISAPTVENGTVTITPESAKSGEKVTITAKPDDGYTVGKVTVKDSSGMSVSVTDNGDGTYTFTMPSGKVTVDVAFVPIEGEPWVNPFTDVSESDWFYDDVAYVTRNGLMVGVGNQQFNPDGTTTRGMIMTILARLDGVDTGDGDPWYEPGMEWAVAEGVSDGTSPEDEITREQFVTMLWRYAGRPTSIDNLSAYSDADKIHDWARDAMAWAVENGIIVGYGGGRLDPQGNALRCQAAALLTRFCKKIVK